MGGNTLPQLVPQCSVGRQEAKNTRQKQKRQNNPNNRGGHEGTTLRQRQEAREEYFVHLLGMAWCDK